MNVGFRLTIAALVLLVGVSTAAAVDLPVASPKQAAPGASSLALTPARIEDRQWSVTLFGGASAGDDRLVELLSSPWSADVRDDYFVGAAVSKRLVRFWNYFTIEPELGVGGRFGNADTPEVWAALYLRFDGFPWNHVVYTTVAVSTGVDYLWNLPPAETRPGDPTSHLLHYFSPEITFALPAYKQYELLIRYHHRSGVFGLFNGVWGGSNIINGGFRYRF